MLIAYAVNTSLVLLAHIEARHDTGTISNG